MSICDFCRREFDSVSSTHIYIGQTIKTRNDGSYQVDADESYHVCPMCRAAISSLIRGYGYNNGAVTVPPEAN